MRADKWRTLIVVVASTSKWLDAIFQARMMRDSRKALAMQSRASAKQCMQSTKHKVQNNLKKLRVSYLTILPGVGATTVARTTFAAPTNALRPP